MIYYHTSGRRSIRREPLKRGIRYQLSQINSTCKRLFSRNRKRTVLILPAWNAPAAPIIVPLLRNIKSYLNIRCVGRRSQRQIRFKELETDEKQAQEIKSGLQEKDKTRIQFHFLLCNAFLKEAVLFTAYDSNHRRSFSGVIVCGL